MRVRIRPRACPCPGARGPREDSRIGRAFPVVNVVGGMRKVHKLEGTDPAGSLHRAQGGSPDPDSASDTTISPSTGGSERAPASAGVSRGP